jgi:hypothetical protein
VKLLCCKYYRRLCGDQGYSACIAGTGVTLRAENQSNCCLNEQIFPPLYIQISRPSIGPTSLPEAQSTLSSSQLYTQLLLQAVFHVRALLPGRTSSLSLSPALSILLLLSPILLLTALIMPIPMNQIGHVITNVIIPMLVRGKRRWKCPGL